MGGWVDGWVNMLVNGDNMGQHEDNVETTWGQHGDHGDVQTTWGQHGDNMGTT